MNDLTIKLSELKKKRNAVILAHNYQLPEVQDVADYVGDSLGLSIEASKTTADVIVFCGVHFMAETAAILNPKRIVIMPDMDAGCPMADMISAEELIEEKKRFPDATVVTYVNSTAAVKAESDICCTSANAVKVVASLKGSNKILFIPDMYLGNFVSKRVPDKQYVFWNGYCPTHAAILEQDIRKAKEQHPKAEVLIHPECRPEVVSLGDQVLSTGGMLSHVRSSLSKEFIIGTEIGMLHRLVKENPGKLFYPASTKAVCPNMKRTNLEKMIWALEEMKNRVVVPDKTAERARRAIEGMLKVI